MNRSRSVLALVLTVVPTAVGLVFVFLRPRLFLLILKNLRRNLRRTILTFKTIVVLVTVVTLIWTVLWFLDQVMTERSRDLKLIVTERWRHYASAKIGVNESPSFFLQCFHNGTEFDT